MTTLTRCAQTHTHTDRQTDRPSCRVDLALWAGSTNNSIFNCAVLLQQLDPSTTSPISKIGSTDYQAYFCNRTFAFPSPIIIRGPFHYTVLFA